VHRVAVEEEWVALEEGREEASDLVEVSAEEEPGGDSG